MPVQSRSSVGSSVTGRARSGRWRNAAAQSGRGLAGGVERHDLERRPVLVDGHEPLAALPADLDLEPRDPAQGALFVVGKDPLDERMPGGEEVEGLVLDGLLAIERADVARPAGNARQAVDQRLVAELDREDPRGRAGARR